MDRLIRDIFIDSLPPPATFSDWRYLAWRGVRQAVILGAITAVGGGTMRDVLIGRIPVVLRSELYAIPALRVRSWW